MPAPEPHRLLSALKTTLAAQGIDVDRVMSEFGQVRASEERARGKEFTLREHVRGLVLALLSNQRPWGSIARNLPQIETIFLDFDPRRARLTDPDYFVRAIRDLRCGNRQIRAQMHAIAGNIETLSRIERDHGSLDRFVTSDNPDIIAAQLSHPASAYKLKQVGYTLALEYLRNVGIRAGKPDMHVRRVLSGQRLAYTSGYPSEEQAYRIVAQLACDAACNPTYLDNLLWMFCARDYGNVCGAQPRCSVCGFVDTCRYKDGDGNGVEHPA